MGNSATGGCCCCGCDVTPDVPENIIPDPDNGTRPNPPPARQAVRSHADRLATRAGCTGEPCEFTVKRAGWSGLSRDYQAFKGLDDPAEENRWLFLNKTGSTFGGNCKIAIENFIRENPDDPKLGQILWEADFIDSPYFQQYLRVPESAAFGVMVRGARRPSRARPPVAVLSASRGWRWHTPRTSSARARVAQFNEMFDNGFGGFLGRGATWHDDDYYLGRSTFDRDYVCTLFINWTLNTHATITTQTRTGYGCDLKLGVYACGTAVRFPAASAASPRLRPPSQEGAAPFAAPPHRLRCRTLFVRAAPPFAGRRDLSCS